MPSTTCPMCDSDAVIVENGQLPVCQECDWTDWPDAAINAGPTPSGVPF